MSETPKAKTSWYESAVSGISNTTSQIQGDLSHFLGNDLPNDTSLTQSRYDFTYRMFPEDIGTSFNGHYMVININARDSSSFANFVTGPGGTTRNGGQLTQTINTFKPLPNELSKTDALRFNIDPKYKSSTGQPLSLSLPLPRYSRRVVESIALYMPGTMAFSSEAVYEPISLTGLGHAMLSAGARGAQNFGHGFDTGIGGGGAIGTILNVGLGIFSGGLGVVEKGAQMHQTPFNPRVEILYANTPQRGFQFEFLFAPTSEKESESIKQIERTLRFHQAPEVNNGFPSALFWTAPSDFDITFFFRGKENTNIPRINTVVLENVDLDFAPTGFWSTFSNGHPVTMRMSLRFRELEVNHKLRVLQGF